MLEAGIPKPFPSISDRGRKTGLAAPIRLTWADVIIATVAA
jgi:hypothetical protein